MNRNLVLTTTSLCIWGIGEGAFVYFQPLYLEQLGADPVRIGAILGFYGLMTMAAHIPAGYLADKIGRRPLLWASWWLGCIAAWIMALSVGLNSFIAGLLIYGLTNFVVSPLNSYVTAARGKLSVERALMLVAISFNLGMVIGPLIGGLIGQFLGLRQIFFFTAALCSISVITISLIGKQEIEAKTAPVEGSAPFFLQKSFLLYMGVVFLAVFALYLPQPLSQNYLQNQHQLDLGQIGSLLAITGIGVVLISTWLGRLPARRGFILAQGLVLLFGVLMRWGTTFPTFALGYFLLGGYKAARSLAAAQTACLVPPRQMGLAYGVLETVACVATSSAPVLAGFLYARQPSIIYVLSTGLIVVSILVSQLFSPVVQRKPTASASTLSVSS